MAKKVTIENIKETIIDEEDIVVIEWASNHGKAFLLNDGENIIIMGVNTLNTSPGCGSIDNYLKNKYTSKSSLVKAILIHEENTPDIFILDDIEQFSNWLVN